LFFYIAFDSVFVSLFQYQETMFLQIRRRFCAGRTVFFEETGNFQEADMTTTSLKKQIEARKKEAVDKKILEKALLSASQITGKKWNDTSFAVKDPASSLTIAVDYWRKELNTGSYSYGGDWIPDGYRDEAQIDIYNRDRLVFRANITEDGYGRVNKINAYAPGDWEGALEKLYQVSLGKIKQAELDKAKKAEESRKRRAQKAAERRAKKEAEERKLWGIEPPEDVVKKLTEAFAKGLKQPLPIPPPLVPQKKSATGGPK
jgi:hypothetical protein